MATSVPVPIARPRSACASAGGVVDAVADHGHDPALGLQPPTTSALSAGSTSAMTSSMPTSAATALAVSSLSPVSSTGRRPSCSSSATAVRRRRLDGVGDHKHRRGRGRPSRRRWRSGRAASAGAARIIELRRQVHRPVGEQGRAPDDDRVAVDDAFHAETLAVRGTPRRRAAGRARRARPLAIGPGDRVLGRVLERARQAQQLAAVRRRRRRARSTSAILPVVTVPVLSSTTVSTWRVDSSTAGPLMSSPSCAPRPVPTSSAVGVASPSAQGQAMMSTATAAVNAKVALSPVPSQKPSVPTATPMTTGTNTPETRSASRWTGALPFWASVTSLAI